MKETHPKTPVFHFLPHVVIIIIGVGVSLLLFFTIRHREKVYLDYEFQHIAQNRVSALERLIQSKFSILDSVRSFFESSEFVDREEFNSFTSSFSDFEGIFAIAWVPRVEDSQREEFEDQAEASGVPDFFIKEKTQAGDFVSAQKRPEYFPVLYIDPYNDVNISILGFDCASEPRRYQALVEARDTGYAVATERIQLVQDHQHVNSFLVFVPLYKNEAPLDTLQQRRESLKGFIVGAFHINTLVKRALSFTDIRHVSLYLYDISAPADEQFLCCYGPDSAGADKVSDSASAVNPSSSLYRETVIDVGTRQWSVVCTPEKALYDLYITENSWAGLAIGLLLTLSVYLYFLFSGRKTEAIQHLVAVRTEELQRELAHRTRAERKLARTAEKLEAKNDELERVMYISSHDLRSPLVTISGFNHELQKSCQQLKSLIDEKAFDEKTKSAINSLLDESIPESLKFIHAGVEKVDMLIDGLLQMSRIGTSPFKIEPVDMTELIHNVIDSHRFQAKERGATITVESLPDCMGDAAKTNQLFSNLVTNALKYLSPERPGKVKITGHVDGDRSIYCVEDNGIGIDPAHHSKIFQMFNRVCPDPAIKGEGLGLAIITRILEGQNGEIWLESEVDKGSKFYVSLPTA